MIFIMKVPALAIVFKESSIIWCLVIRHISLIAILCILDISRRCSSNQRSQLEMGRKYCSAHAMARLFLSEIVKCSAKPEMPSISELAISTVRSLPSRGMMSVVPSLDLPFNYCFRYLSKKGAHAMTKPPSPSSPMFQHIRTTLAYFLSLISMISSREFPFASRDLGEITHAISSTLWEEKTSKSAKPRAAKNSWEFEQAVKVMEFERLERDR